MYFFPLQTRYPSQRLGEIVNVRKEARRGRNIICAVILLFKTYFIVYSLKVILIF